MAKAFEIGAGLLDPDGAAGTHEGQLFLAMDFVAGQSLEAVFAARKRPPARRTAELVREVAEALASDPWDL